MQRRRWLQLAGATAATACIPSVLHAAVPKKRPAPFKFCLNTSTISGQKIGLPAMIETAAKAGYDFVELWIRDIREYQEQGKSLASLKKLVSDNGIGVASAIGFAPWMVADEQARRKGFAQMEEEMNMMAELGARRIAAAPAGLGAGTAPDLFAAGQYYKELLSLGRKTGVMPQLEFWGASPAFYHLGQVLMVAASANDPDTRILADVYHLFRGGSGFDSLKLLNGSMIEIFHMNDYPSTIPREMQKDGDRVFPGDGAAPMTSILQTLAASGGTKILSLELFNPEYWKRDALSVARIGLEKMKNSVSIALQ